MDDFAQKENLIGVFTTDAKYIVQVWDAALEEMTGISAGEARGNSIVETIPDLETRGILERFERVLKEGTVEILAPAFHRFLIPCAPRFPSKHFAEMRQRVTIAPLRDDESIRGIIVTIEDVTARIERERELTGELQNPDESVRLEAAKAIADASENLVEEDAVPIIDALKDQNWRVRRKLVESLSQRAAPEAIAALLRAMQERHLDFGVLNSALQVLQSTSVKTTETLLEFLRGDDADLRMQAALTLGEQKDAQAIPGLLAALGDENVNVRYHAAEALGKRRAREAVAPLLEIAETRDFFMSFVALDAVRQIGDKEAAPRILPLLGDEFLRAAAIDTLGALGREEIVAPLIELLNADRTSAPGVARALAALAERCAADAAKTSEIIARARKTIDDRGLTNLAAAFESADEAATSALIRVAGWFDDARMRAALATLLEDENAREEAARALAAQGEAGVDLLISMLDGGDPETGKTAARALGETKEERAFEPLVRLLAEGDAVSRFAAVGALKSLAHSETAARLLPLFDAEDAGVREAAIRVVGALDAKNCERQIFTALAETNERVRRAAIEQLPLIGGDRAVAALIRILRDGSSRDREAAAKALAQVAGDEAVAALREALGDRDAWTRYFAVRALTARADAASGEILSEMAEKDEAEFVRAAAREALNKLND